MPMFRDKNGEISIYNPLVDTARKEGFQNSIEFSIESVRFHKYYMAGISIVDEPWFSRCLDASKRMCGREMPLISPIGYCTPLGTVAYSDASVLMNVLRRQPGGVPHPDLVTAMDEIVLNATLPMYCIRILAFLWHTLKDDEKGELSERMNVNVSARGGDWVAPFVEYNERVWVPMRHIRSNAYARYAVDKLINLQLIETGPLGKPENTHTIKRGPQPVGFAITGIGKRFFADYIREMDSTVDPGRVDSVYHNPTDGSITVVARRPGSMSYEPDEVAKQAPKAVKAPTEPKTDIVAPKSPTEQFDSTERIEPKPKLDSRSAKLDEKYKAMRAELLNRQPLGPPVNEPQPKPEQQDEPDIPDQADNNDDDQELLPNGLTKAQVREKLRAGMLPSEIFADRSEDSGYGRIDSSDIDPVTGENLREIFGGG